MAASKTSLRTVINQVTKEKLAWLDNQKETLKTIFTPLLEKFEKPENKASLEFLKEIHTTLKNSSEENPIPQKTKDLDVFMNWIQLNDPNGIIYFGSEDLVKHWIEMLIKHIKFQIERCEYSCLYANVMTQYMDGNSKGEVEMEHEMGNQDTLSNKQKTMQEFSERIFTAPKDFDVKEFETFLDTVFKDDEGEQSEKGLLQWTRRQVKSFCEGFSSIYNNDGNTTDLKLCIDGLLAEDLLGAEKAIVLRELRNNEDALSEVSTLLQSRVQKYKEWSWPEAVRVDFRRNMAGRYRAYMDEDIITAIFLHYVGAKWSIFFKDQFMKIYSSKMWIRGTDTVGDLYYKPHSIEGYRRELHKTSFLSILPSKMADLAGNAELYDEGKRHTNKSDLTPMKIKQRLLHLISNEIHLNNVLRPETDLTIVQTDMEWFGPSLIHDAVITVMKFFGVTTEWLQFFRRFMESPLKVGSASAAVQTRKRGVPISHSLSTLFGESLLFIMDLYVNGCSGLSVMRIHDDFWFWSHKSEKVVKAWEAMIKYTKLAGLTLSKEKSASVICNPSNYLPDQIFHGPAPLPQVKVKWGFIFLHSDGVFRINQELLDPHVTEMRKCLDKSDTVMSWIHCHNSYLRFIIRNCATQANAFEKQHVVQILNALQNILIKVHPETNGDMVKALKKKFYQILGDKEVMDSWFYWSVEKVGLSLYNPFLELIPLHEAYRKREEIKTGLGSTSGVFGEIVDQDHAEWRRLLEESKKRQKRRSQYMTEEIDEETVTDVEETYETEYEDVLFEDEYAADQDSFNTKKFQTKKLKAKKRIGRDTWLARYRETRWQRWRVAYCDLFNKLEPINNGDANYWRQYLYSGQMAEKLGDNNDSFVDSNLVPLSLITTMQGAKVHKN